MRTKKKESNSVGLGLFFFLALFLILLISFSFKAYASIKNSKFDSSVAFLVVGEGIYKWSVIEILPGNKLNVLDLSGKPYNFSELYIPSYSTVPLGDEINVKDKASSVLLFSDNLTLYDKIRLYYFLFSLDQENIKEKTLVLYESVEQNLQEIDDFLYDPEIVSEKASIQIINATGRSQLAGKYARGLEHLGANVILTTTDSDVIEKSSIISNADDSHTLKLIQKIIGIKASGETNPEVADIVITLGKDLLGEEK